MKGFALYSNRIGRLTSLLILSSFLWVASAYGSIIEHRIDFDPNNIKISGNGNYADISVPDLENTFLPGKPSIPYIITKLLIPLNDSVDSIKVSAQYKSLGGNYLVNYSRKPTKTSLLEPYAPKTTIDEEIYNSNKKFPKKSYNLIDEGYWGANHIISIQLFPIIYYPAEQTLEVSKVLDVRVFTSYNNSKVFPIANPKPIPSEQLESAVDNFKTAINFADISPQGLSRSPILQSPVGDSNTDYEYVVITDESLAESYKPLVEWKTRKGVYAGIVTIQEIDAEYSGLDLQEKIRNYIKDAYQHNLKWVLLGGDENIVPVRYAFQIDTSHNPDLVEQQICDLYYSDLTGDWDTDGDGVYGEPLNDNPDIYPEVYVGRVTAETPEEVKAYINKLLIYEQNPGNGDTSYLSKALFIAADQMVDDNQQIELGNTMPSNFFVDTTSCVERQSGYDEDPIGPTGRQVIDKMGEGFGFVSNLNHGSPQHYAAKSSLYNKFPKSYVISDVHYDEDHNAPLTDLPENSKYGVHYSVSCDVAAIDMDHSDIWVGYSWPTNNCLGESYIEIPNKAGVAFLGNSRWGWVPTSYILEEAFIRYAFGNNPMGRHIGGAEALSKTDYPEYRDLDYGHNLLGDPEFIIWKGNPSSFSVDYQPEVLLSGKFYRVAVKSDGTPVEDAKVCLYKENEFLAVGYTNGYGEAILEVSPKTSGDMSITVTKDGFLPFLAETELIPETDVGESDKLPTKFSLIGNYPNPFNKSTILDFTLNKLSDVGISIYDIRGRIVRTESLKGLSAGEHLIKFDAVDNDGRELPSGFYLYRIATGDESAVGKMVLVK